MSELFTPEFLQKNDGQIYRAAVKEIEKELIMKVLVMTRGNQVQAAKKLGINRMTLRRRMADLNMYRDTVKTSNNF